MAKLEYNPQILPTKIDFHKATKGFPLSREHKTKLQVALSQMTISQVRDTIKQLGRMEYECLEGKAKIEWERIGKYIVDEESQAKVFKRISPDLQDDFKMAIWCKFCREFAEKYLYSVKEQKKI